ncbi:MULTISPECIES: TonB-dependent receptor family protein [Tatumella]|uniref:TonB-dependent receptor family protein n=1 Tax=Tatumella punctata TaxID=399969 RepID=A0ABW1VKC1_9GAMM|nr:MULTISPECIES: TonB-dependent siderophore receptor [unclassified Tatumella]MBS0857600.1 TonB-dependent siderophore receptor [Tatumella sp. JGM16]MBS0895041.1 TonB-dependent siderophore receptor [Tatumella sp. JGM130]MBS0914300.1 TonB-dependent siderophore receptor [Tatumella sp. JGM91]
MTIIPRISLLTSAVVIALPVMAAETAADKTSSPATSVTAPVTGNKVTVVGNWLDTPDISSVLLDHPGARTYISAQQMRERGDETLADALQGVPGVQIRGSNGTGGSDISLNVGVRGLPARLSPRSTILMDGIPLATAPYGQPQLSMAPLSMGNIESVDVIRGGGTVRYGPQNVGGIINFTTKPIPEKFGGSASVQTRGAKTGGLKTLTSASVGGMTDNKRAGAGILYSGLHGQGYRKSNDNTDIDDFILKTQYSLTEQDLLQASFHYYDASSGMPGGLTRSGYAQDPYASTRKWDHFDARRKDMSFKYKHQQQDRQLEVMTYFTDSFRGSNIETEGGVARPGQRRMITYPRHYSTWAIEPGYSQSFLTGEIAQEVTLGYRYLNETMDEKAYRSGWYNIGSQYSSPATPDYYQHTSGGTRAHALYLDDAINVGDWTITPGIRYENIRTHLDNGIQGYHREKHYSEPLPSLNVMYHLSDEWKLFANTNTSFGSMQYFQLNTGGKGDQSADGLTAEKAHSYEFGTRYDDTVLKAEATLFYINFDNELQYVNDRWTNMGATRHKGIETSVSYDLGALSHALEGISAYTTYTYTKAEAIRGAFSGKDLPFYSRQVFTVGGRYQTGNWTWNLDSFARSKQYSPGSGSQYITQESADGLYGNMPGYMVWNFRGAYDFGAAWNGLTLGAGINNLFDQQYFTRSTDPNSGKYIGEPRTYFVQASVTF